MASEPGLSPLVFAPEQRAALEERLRADLAARDTFAPAQAAALERLERTLRPDSMEPELPPRHLLAYDLTGPAGPTAAVCLGEPAEATHLTWVVSGMGIRADTAVWETAREAGRLLLAQQAAGAPRPVTVAWLRYAAPGPWQVVLDRPARRGGAQLAADIAAWWDFLHDSGLRARGTAVHGAVEAHSYGTLVAGHALRVLGERGLLPADPRAADPTAHHAERPVESLVVSGAIGLPGALVAGAEALSRATGRVFQASAPGDRLARLGRHVALRRRWPGAVPLPVEAGPGLPGASVRGHLSSHWTPEAPEGVPRGYRDPGSVTLAATALVTAGLPLPVG